MKKVIVKSLILTIIIILFISNISLADTQYYYDIEKSTLYEQTDNNGQISFIEVK